ncbi:MAG: tail fiber protein [Bacteroidetes bacterium]|nr:tail fiber protein [Bacteroidota bacterium]
MSSDQYYIGQIIPYSSPAVPDGWHLCDGSLLNIREYQAMYSLLGTTYGGDGRNTFGLPNLSGRSVVSASSSVNLVLNRGQIAGSATVTLNANNIPAHTHPNTVLNAVNARITIPCDTTRAAAVKKPVDACPSVSVSPNMYASGTSVPGTVNMVPPVLTQQAGDPQAGANSGGMAHENMMPYCCIGYIICTNGLYPSRP